MVRPSTMGVGGRGWRAGEDAMDNLRDCAGGGFVLPDGTTVALENVEAMSRAVAGLCAGDPDAAVRMLCTCALDIHEAGLPGLVPEYLARARAAGGSDEGTARAILGLGVDLERADDHPAAAACYASAMDLPEREPFTWYFLHNNLGYCLNAQGEFAGAVVHCLAAVRVDPDRHNAFKNLGIALQGLGRVDEAAGCFRHACILGPEDGRSRRHLADLLYGGRLDAVPDLGARAGNAKRARACVVQAEQEGGAAVGGRSVPLDDFDAMYLALAEQLDEDAGCVCIALGMLAWLHAVRGTPLDLARAADHIVAAAAPAEAADALVSCADNLAAFGRNDEALAVFARAEALLPAADDFVRQRWNSRLGACLMHLARHREAEPRLREALRLDPWLHSAHRGLGVALLARGRADEAEREIRIADALSGSAPGRLAGPP
jgi:tetratricopeptide (TPR) repeat protein